MKFANDSVITCSLFKKNIRAFIDDELPVNIRTIFLRHIEQCPLCACDLKDMQQVKRTVSRLPMVAVSPEFDFRLKSSIRRERENLRNPWYVFKLFLNENMYKLVIIPTFGIVLALGVVSFHTMTVKTTPTVPYEVSSQIDTSKGVDLTAQDDVSTLPEERYVLETVRLIDVERGVFLKEQMNSSMNVPSHTNVVLVSY